MANREVEGPMEIALVGDLSENQTSLCEKLLEVESGGECVLYIDSLGGSPYVAMAITTLILIRDLRNRHRGRRVLVGRSVALRRLRKAFGHALQRPSFPPHEVAERGERGPGRGHGMGQAFPPTRERHGSPAGRHVPCAVRKNPRLVQPRPLHSGPGSRRSGTCGTDRTQAAGDDAEETAEVEGRLA